MEIIQNYLLKKNLLYVQESTKVGDYPITAQLNTILNNFASLGYTLSENIILALEKLEKDEIVEWYTNILKVLKNNVGYSIQYNNPLFINFPEQVMDMEEPELYTRAFINYVGSYLLGETIRPEVQKVVKPYLKRGNLTILDLADENTIKGMVSNIVSSKVSLQEECYEFFERVLVNKLIEIKQPEIFENKEVLANVLSTFLDNNIPISYPNLTATDILRILCALQGQDVSLSSKIVFSNLSRKQRRDVLSMLDKIQYNNLAEDMLRHKILWVRLGEILHPKEYNRFQNVNKAFDVVRGDIKYRTFNSLVEMAIKEKRYNDAINYLIRRPGDFARKLDLLIRSYSPGEVLYQFKTVADKVPTTILLQLLAFYKNRNSSKGRLIFPKGNVAKAIVVENNLPEIDKNTVGFIICVIEDILIKMFSRKESLGKVYLDKKLKSYLTPLSIRNSSKGKKTLVRGSRVKIKDDTNIIRLFLHWKNITSDDNEQTRTDVDLSAVFYNGDFKNISTISFRDLKNEYSVHSGDIVDAPKGACEYIDIDLKKLPKDIKYIAMLAQVYTNDKFSQIPECFVGWMGREDLKTGDIYEASTVENKIDVCIDSTSITPAVFDVVNREVVWFDLAGSNLSGKSITAGNIKEEVGLLAKSIVDMTNTRPNLYDLLLMHTVARGERTYDIEEADTIFSLEKGITPYDIEKIVSEFL